MLEIQVKPVPPKNSPPLLYVRPGQKARFIRLAELYGMQNVELFEQVLAALEADMDGRQPDQEKS